MPPIVTLLLFVSARATIVNCGNGTAPSTSAKGVFAEKAETLTGDIAESTSVPATSMVLSESSTDAKDAIVTFTNLKTAASGKVYLFQGSGDNDTFSEISGLANEKAIATMDVTGGSTTVTFDDVFSGVDTNDTKNMYVAKFVPENSLIWSTLCAGTTSSTVFKLAKIARKLEFDPSAAASTVTTTESSDGTTVFQLNSMAIVDQFGEEITGTGADVGVTAATCTAIDDGGAYKEAGTATYTITNGIVSLTQERVTALSGIDYADGFKMTVLGTDFVSYSLDNKATTGNATYKLTTGDKTLIAGTNINTEVVTYNQMKKALAVAAADTSTDTTVTMTEACTIPASDTVAVGEDDTLLIDGAELIVLGTLNVNGTSAHNAILDIDGAAAADKLDNRGVINLGEYATIQSSNSASEDIHGTADGIFNVSTPAQMAYLETGASSLAHGEAKVVINKSMTSTVGAAYGADTVVPNGVTLESAASDATGTGVLTIQKGGTFKIGAGTTFTIGGDDTVEIFGRFDNGTTTGILAAADKEINLHDGSEFVGQKTAAKLTDGTKFMISADCVSDGAKITDNDGTNSGQSVTFKIGTHSADASPVVVSTSNVTTTSAKTITIVGNGTALTYQRAA